MSTAGPATTPNLGVRVLSLDGGGVRVLSQLLILQNMMYRAQQSLGRDTALSPCEYFELIGGSGMGGVIALMLGRLRMSIADVLSVYEKLRPQSKWGGGEVFKASKFEKVLQEIFREEMMKDDHADACKTFVCARNEMNLNAGIPELFRSYNTPEEPASGCMIWEAARATTATPDLFKPVEINLGGRKQRYSGGSLGHNNPTSVVLAEAHTLYPSRAVVLVASIGSGHPKTIQIPESHSSGDLTQAMSQIVQDCEKTHEDNAHRFQGIPNTYFRFNVQQGMQELAPQDWEKSSKVSAHTGAYLKTQDVKAKLTQAVQVLLNPVITASDTPAYLKVCPAPSIRFTGRQDILRKMVEYFDADLGRRHIFLLHGLGGSGKSQVAFKFIDQSESRFSDIYFMDCSSQQTLENDLVTLALVKKLGKSPDDSLLWLSHQHKKWLIVFNNADDTHLNLVRYFPSGSHGNIIITSRNPDLRQHADTEYKVDGMEVHEATELLLSTARYEMPEPENEEIAKRLVQRLHCLPLAVAQAGAYIASSRRLDRYLELYESTADRIQLLNTKPKQFEYNWSVYTTWQISFEKLSLRAAELLQLCSFIHHSGITEEIFRQAASYKFTAEEKTQLREPLKFLANFLSSSSSKWDSLKFIALTTELGGYSLIEFEAGSRAITFSIHPLVHEWCRTTLESEAPAELCMHKMVGMSLSTIEEFRFGHLVFPHLDSLLFKGTEDSAREPNVLDLAFAGRYLRIYDEEGRWNDGVKLGTSMLQMATPELQERKTLQIRAWLATMYQGHGNFDQARTLREQILSQRLRLLGKHDPDTVVAMGNLAATYLALGQFKQAEELQQTVLNMHREILGEKHPDTLRAMANLARTYSALGQFKQAEKLEQTVLKMRREILGEEHPGTLMAMANLAVTYWSLRRFKEAEELGTRVLDKHREILGQNHPYTMMAMGNLAATYLALGQLKQAEELQQTVLNMCREILGEKHPDTLRAMANLARTYSALGQFKQAEDLEQTVLKMCREILGEEHPGTLMAMANLAATYWSLRRFKEAEELGTRVLDKHREILSQDHPYTMVAMGNLAHTYLALGQSKQAEALEQTVLKMRREILGEEHPDTLRAMANLAATYWRLGRFKEAEELEIEVLDKRRVILGQNHPHTLLAMGNLVRTYSDLGQFKQAQELEQTVLNMRREILGEEHPHTLLAMQNLAVTYSNLGRSKEAGELKDAVADIHRKGAGEEHPQDSS